MTDYYPKEQRKNYNKNYRETHKKQIKKYFRNYQKEHQKEHKESNLKWAKNNPEKVKANMTNQNAKHPERGSNKHRTPEQWVAHNHAEEIPLAEWCEVCPEDNVLKATIRHHPDYKYPTIFISCCASCHSYHHKGRKQIC